MRNALHSLGLAATLGALLASSGPLPAQSTTNIEGAYKRIQPARVLEESDKVEVVDVFSYGCPHCYRFLPHLEAFARSAPEYVVIRRAPVIFNDSWIPLARAYHTAALLGVADRVHEAIFVAIHEQRRPLNNKEQLMALFAEHGVAEAEFSATFDSFTVDTLTRQSEVMVRRWGVTGTPSVIVNGRYLISGTLAGSYENMIEVLRALIEKEHEAMKTRRASG